MDSSIIYCLFISIIYGIISIILSSRIKERKNQLYLSLRSTNILQITNISITCSNIIVIFSFTPIEKKGETRKNLIYNIYLVLQIILFISLIFKYHRLVICSEISREDDLENFKYFKIQNHYFQFFFIRILLIVSVLLLLITIPLSLFTQIYLEPLFYVLEKEIQTIPIIIWTSIFTIENSLLFIYALFVFKKDLKAHLKMEILLLVILNVIYSSTIAIDLFSSTFHEEEYEQYITILYFILLQLLTIFWPIWACRVEDITTAYNVTREAAEDFYLCLSNEKSYNKFEIFLMDDIILKDANLKALELYTRIMRFKLVLNLNGGKVNDLLKEDLEEIHNKFLINKKSLGFEEVNNEEDEIKANFEDVKQHIVKALEEDECDKKVLDRLLELVFDYLNEKFIKFKESERFKELICEIGYETYVRCKLTNCGLLKK